MICISQTSDPSLTPRNVFHVMEMVQEREWQSVGLYLVPESIWDSIDAKYSTHKEKISALASYVATIIPDITWENIATLLYWCDQHRAVERVKPYLNIVHGELRCILSCCDVTQWPKTIIPEECSNILVFVA